jgi:tetrapyrrole methylase family protein/MazG family protein
MNNPTIRVVGLGPGNPGSLTIEALEVMRQAKALYLRTQVHPTVDYLIREKIEFSSFDFVYDQMNDFPSIYQEICRSLMAQLENDAEIVYAVPGHPMIAEETVRLLIEASQKGKFSVEIISGMSFLEPLLALVGYDPTNGLQLLDALDFSSEGINLEIPSLFMQVHDRMVASELKLSLMNLLGDDYRVALIRAAGVPAEEECCWLPLHEIDRQTWIDHLTTLYVPALKDELAGAGQHLKPIIRIMNRLRGEGGCPWDQEQNHQSLRQYVIEEAYEVVEAIDSQDPEKIEDELGDLLLQVIFHSRIAEEQEHFDISGVIRAISQKMIRRHPHVFGNVEVEDSAHVLRNWEEIKRNEKKEFGGALSGVSETFPALMFAEKLQNKAKKVGFDWPDYRGGMEKLREELQELEEAIAQNNNAAIEEEMGDVLFATVNCARLLGVSAEVALFAASRKFRQRFQIMEQLSIEKGQDLRSLDLEALEILWNCAKDVYKSRLCK